MTRFEIHQAVDTDVPRVAELWTAASRDLATRGLDQWQYPVKTNGIRKAVEAGTCWVIDDAEGLAATVTVDEEADPAVWLPADEPADALYVHRLVIRGDLRGGDLGSAILDWAGERAANSGKHWLRLDAWSTNPGLHRYYLDRGFHLVRTVEGPDIVSGVAFERAADTPRGRGPAIVTRQAPTTP